jgi:hypothetical protein
MYSGYLGYGNWRTGGHCVIGSQDVGTTWFLAEGYTGEGYV